MALPFIADSAGFLLGAVLVSRLVYRDEHNPERHRLLATRAVMSLPTDHLLQYSSDPIGDLIRGDHDALVAALLADSGLAAAQPASA